GEVLDVEDGQRRVVGPGAVVPRAFAARAELGVGRAADCDRPRVAHHIEGEVQHVHAKVDQGTAAGQRPGGEPAAKAGDAATTRPTGFGVVDRAKRSLVDQALENEGVGDVAA